MGAYLTNILHASAPHSYLVFVSFVRIVTQSAQFRSSARKLVTSVIYGRMPRGNASLYLNGTRPAEIKFRQFISFPSSRFADRTVRKRLLDQICYWTDDRVIGWCSSENNKLVNIQIIKNSLGIVGWENCRSILAFIPLTRATEERLESQQLRNKGLKRN